MNSNRRRRFGWTALWLLLAIDFGIAATNGSVVSAAMTILCSWQASASFYSKEPTHDN